uniref:Uncharacterized protein n=1 Tax=Pseudopediastrum sp. CL0201VA TaxID=2184484 RepID=A0A2U8GJU8_9CHLO|nr:hypothetical protein [Pseudopediastrum sp. CL0201VA]AWI68919.1 hypothetical protein [Pseudopediastrum sp. CL0201VA]
MYYFQDLFFVFASVWLCLSFTSPSPPFVVASLSSSLQLCQRSEVFFFVFGFVFGFGMALRHRSFGSVRQSRRAEEPKSRRSEAKPIWRLPIWRLPIWRLLIWRLLIRRLTIHFMIPKEGD